MGRARGGVAVMGALVALALFVACADYAEETLPPDGGVDGAIDAFTADVDTSTSSDANVDETSVIEAGGDASIEAEAGATECPVECSPKAPVEWIGPSAVYDSTSSDGPSCSGSYAVTERIGSQYDLPPGASCSCGSSTVNGATTCRAEVSQYSAAACAGGALAFAMASGQCTQTTSTSFKFGTPVLDGSCTDALVIASIPSAPVVRRIRACGLPSAATCEGHPRCSAMPLPLPPSYTRICIHKEGDVACPGADYPARTVVHTSMQDTRQCECKETLLGQCPPQVGFFADSDCAVKDTTAPAGSPNTCYPQAGHPSVGGSMTLDGPTNVTCTVQPISTGTFKTIDPVTFCCRN